MADMTNLEQNIMRDYGQYLTVPLNTTMGTYAPQQQRYGTAMWRPANFQKPISEAERNAQLATNVTALQKLLPSGVNVVNNQLQIAPSSDLYKKYAPMLSDPNAKVFNSSILADLQKVVSTTQPKTSSPVLNWGNAFGRQQSNINPNAGALSLLGVIPQQPKQYAGFGLYKNVSPFSNSRIAAIMGAQRPAPVNPIMTAAPVMQTRTMDQAMQEYANANKFDMNKIMEQIAEQRRTREQLAAAPKTLEELNAQYLAPEQQYAQGGRVKTHYKAGDLVDIPAPDYNNVPTEQQEPSGGGYVAPAMLTANPELNTLLQGYNLGADYSEELKAARQQRKESETAFNKSMQDLLTSADSGPSKAELYWKLASAFGTPGKTGSFGESLVQATGQMADYSKEQRVAEQAKRKLRTDIALKQQEMALESAKDTEKTLLGLQAEAGKDRREMLKTAVKDYIDSGKPQSEAGRIAKDKGLKVGTPEYQAEVDKQANLLIEKQLGAIRAQLLTGQATLANISVQQSKEQREAEKQQREAVKLEPDERKAIRDDEDAMHAANTTIKNIDEAMGLVDKAFGNTVADKTTYRKLKQTNPNDPRVIATEQLDNLLGTNALGSLKAVFGGNPTEGERNAMKELQGLGAASPESRKKILERAQKALKEGAEYRSMRINKIETGGYRKKPEGK